MLRSGFQETRVLIPEQWDIESRLGCCAVGGEPMGERAEEGTRGEKSCRTRSASSEATGAAESLQKAVELPMQEYPTECCKDRCGMFCMVVVLQMGNNGLGFQRGR